MEAQVAAVIQLQFHTWSVVKWLHIVWDPHHLHGKDGEPQQYFHTGVLTSSQASYGFKFLQESSHGMKMTSSWMLNIGAQSGSATASSILSAHRKRLLAESHNHKHLWWTPGAYKMYLTSYVPPGPAAFNPYPWQWKWHLNIDHVNTGIGTMMGKNSCTARPRGGRWQVSLLFNAIWFLRNQKLLGWNKWFQLSTWCYLQAAIKCARVGVQ